MTTTCQICARPIKAKNGRIAHHGYKRPGQGWQTASCFGAKYRPYEVACDALPRAIESCQRYIALDTDRLAKLHAAPPDSLTATDRRKRVTTADRPADFNPITPRHSYRPGSYEQMFADRVHGYVSSIASAKASLQEMSQRLADWTPAAS